MKRVLSAIDTMSDMSGRVFSYLFFIVVFVIIYEVVLRYIFNAPTLWANETMIYLCAVCYTMGGAFTFYYRQHVSVDILYSRFGMRRRALLDVITFFAFIIYMTALVWYGGKYAWSSVKLMETSGSPWNPPIYPIKLTIPVGALMMTLQGVAKFIRDLHILATGKEL